jgi:hypothetical protein
MIFQVDGLVLSQRRKLRLKRLKYWLKVTWLQRGKVWLSARASDCEVPCPFRQIRSLISVHLK